MKQILKPTTLPWLVLGCGGIGLALRSLMYLITVDDRGLLTSGNFLDILSWVLTILVVGGLLAMLWKLDGSNRYADNFGASIPGAVGSFLAAAGILVTLLSSLSSLIDSLSRLWLIFGFLSVVCMVAAGLYRWKGQRPIFLFHAVVCVFLALNLANQYRLWSGKPQLADYCFQLFACVCLMLSVYHRCAFDAGLGQRRAHLFTSLMAVYLCCLSLAKTDTPLLYLACGAWAFTNLCPLDPPPRRRRPGGISPADIPSQEAP